MILRWRKYPMISFFKNTILTLSTQDVLFLTTQFNSPWNNSWTQIMVYTHMYEIYKSVTYRKVSFLQTGHDATL